MQQVNAPGVRWEWISEAWNLFTKQWSVWVLMILVMYLVFFALYLPFLGIFAIMAPSIPQGDEIPKAPAFPVGFFVVYPVIWVALLCVISWLAGGLYNAALKQVRGEQIALGDLFSGTPYFVRMMGAVFLIAIASGIGSVFCLIPGLIIYGLTFLAYPMIVDGGKGTIDAIKASIDVTKKDWIMFTVFAVAVVFVAAAGGFACGVGLLATAPLLYLTHALAYRDCVGMPDAQGQGQFMQQAPPTDYWDYTPSETHAEQPPQSPAWSAPTIVTPVDPEPATKTCPQCGATLTRVANFCNQCGSPLRSA